MGIKVTNNAFGTLNAGIGASDTVLVLEAGQGVRFPALTPGDYFYATLIDTSNNLEIVRVTGRATDTLTVVRGQDGTTARAYNVNDRLELRPVAALFNEMVALSGTQTVVGPKTFTDPDTSIALSGPGLLGADSAGQSQRIPLGDGLAFDGGQLVVTVKSVGSDLFLFQNYV